MGEAETAIDSILSRSGVLRGLAQEIQERAAAIHQHLTGVQDKVPAWMGVAKWAGIAVACLALLGLAIYLGIGSLTRPAISLAGNLISRVTASEAKLDAEATVLASTDPAAAIQLHQRAVTLARASDPSYDASFQAAKTAAEAHRQPPTPVTAPVSPSPGSTQPVTST